MGHCEENPRGGGGSSLPIRVGLRLSLRSRGEPRRVRKPGGDRGTRRRFRYLRGVARTRVGRVLGSRRHDVPEDYGESGRAAGRAIDDVAAVSLLLMVGVLVAALASVLFRRGSRGMPIDFP